MSTDWKNELEEITLKSPEEEEQKGKIMSLMDKIVGTKEVIPYDRDYVETLIKENDEKGHRNVCHYQWQVFANNLGIAVAKKITFLLALPRIIELVEVLDITIPFL